MIKPLFNLDRGRARGEGTGEILEGARDIASSSLTIRHLAPLHTHTHTQAHIRARALTHSHIRIHAAVRASIASRPSSCIGNDECGRPGPGGAGKTRGRSFKANPPNQCTARLIYIFAQSSMSLKVYEFEFYLSPLSALSAPRK